MEASLCGGFPVWRLPRVDASLGGRFSFLSNYLETFRFEGGSLEQKKLLFYLSGEHSSYRNFPILIFSVFYLDGFSMFSAHFF